MSDGFTRLRSNLRKIRHANILELGAGIGTLTCQLAIQMNNITAFEPNDVIRGFMKYRISDMLSTPGMESTVPVVIETEEWWNEIEDESQDYIMAFDVFEHIPLDELNKIIGYASKKLKPGARLLYHNNWEQQDIFPMHLDHSEHWRQILEDNGFLEISPMEAVKKI